MSKVILKIKSRCIVMEDGVYLPPSLSMLIQFPY